MAVNLNKYKPLLFNNKIQLGLFSSRTSSAASIAAKTGILMLNMGGPQSITDVHDFLLRLFTDRDIIQLPFQKYLGPWIAKRRTPSIQKKYEEIGGGSPILKWTEEQGALMCKKLDELSPQTAPHKHYVGFRYARPLTEETLQQMEKDQVQHCIAFSQYPQYSCSTSGSSMNTIHRYFDKKGENKPSTMQLSIIDRWYTNSSLVQCFAQNIHNELMKFPENERHKVYILFSAHSLPLKQVNRGDTYPSEVSTTVQLVMQQLQQIQEKTSAPNNPYRLVWQSKVGPLPWLAPATEDAIKGSVQRGYKSLMLVPIAFTNEHIETLHELDIEYIKEFGEKIGAERIARCPAPNTHPLFIDALVSEVLRHLKGGSKCSSQFLTNCPLCINPSCFRAKKWFRYATGSFV